LLAKVQIFSVGLLKQKKCPNMKISQKCYAITGLAAEPPWAVNAGFIVGDTITLIVDTGSNYLTAQSIFGYAHSIKSDNSCKVVNTELHFDHIGGNFSGTTACLLLVYFIPYFGIVFHISSLTKTYRKKEEYHGDHQEEKEGGCTSVHP